MPLNDKVIQFDDLVQEKAYVDRAARGGLPNNYINLLSTLYQQEHGERIPPLPPATIDARDSDDESAVGTRAGITKTVDAFVNGGRWLWQCQACNSAIYVKEGSPSICPICAFDGWVNVAMPAEKDDIEAELLRQPGFRGHSPIRNWRPGQSLSVLRMRTRVAQRKIAEGVPFPRSLSIGATRTWAVAEILTASNMNTYISDVLDDLAGRNGEAQIEGPIKVNDGSGQYLELPTLTTTQRNALTAADGMMIYNSTTTDVEVRTNGTWRGYRNLADNFLSGFAQGDILFVNSSGVLARLAAGTANYLLRTDGAGADPVWVTPPITENEVNTMTEVIMYG